MFFLQGVSELEIQTESARERGTGGGEYLHEKVSRKM